jgi:hypothetical protein
MFWIISNACSCHGQKIEYNQDNLLEIYRQLDISEFYKWRYSNFLIDIIRCYDDLKAALFNVGVGFV